MSIMDKSLEFDPTGTAITATAVSTNVIDLGVGRDMGSGAEGDASINVLVLCETALTGGTSLNVEVQGAPDNGSGAPGTYVTLIESGVIPAASLTAGATVLRCALPRRRTEADPLPRFLILNYVVVGPFTGGTVHSILEGTRQDNIAYKPGTVVYN